MFVVGGVREGGRVERCDGAYVVTSFVHVNYLPLLPVRSEVHAPNGERRTMRLSLTSVLAGYLRSWPLLGVAAAMLGALLGVPAPARAALGLASCAALALGWGLLGRVGAVERAKRRVLADVIGAAIDPAWVVAELPALRESLYNAWMEAAGQGGAAGYRGSPSLEATAEHGDAESVRLGFMLARVERAMATSRAARTSRAALEARLWSRLVALSQAPLAMI